VLHRAEVAVAMVSSNLVGALLRFVSNEVGAGVGPAVASFIVSLLQPELALQPEWVSESPVMQATVFEARRASAIFASKLEQHVAELWQLLAAVPEAFGGRVPLGFVQDCATLSFMTAPSEQDFQLFATRCLTSSGPSGISGALDPAVLAPLCVLAANAGVSPDEGGILTSVLAAAPNEVRAGLQDRWAHWKGSPLTGSLASWREAAAVAGIVEEQRLPPPAENPPRPPVPAEALPPQPKKGAVLGALLSDAPSPYCCQLDHQLMMDPVRSPYGHVFDRATLARVLASRAGQCPLTGQPLSLEHCERLPDLRKQIQVWVRGHQNPGRRKPQLASAAMRGTPVA